jgi:hypothetical protein
MSHTAATQDIYSSDIAPSHVRMQLLACNSSNDAPPITLIYITQIIDDVDTFNLVQILSSVLYMQQPLHAEYSDQSGDAAQPHI